MAKRVKKIIITGVTREAADEAFAKYAKADAESAKITADIELQCAKIREKYAGRLAELDAAKTVAFDTLQSFATEKTEEVAKDKLLADRDMDVRVKDGAGEVKLSQEMTRCGIQVVQDETFYVEPKKEETA